MSEIPKRVHFSKVREAREALKADALELKDLMKRAAKLAIDTGDFESGIDALKYLMEHMPDEDGVTMINSSIDVKAKEPMGPKGPSIQIGIQLGGMPTSSELPPAPVPLALPDTTVIDVLPDVIEEPCQTSPQPKPKSARPRPQVSTSSLLAPPSAQSADDKPSS